MLGRAVVARFAPHYDVVPHRRADSDLTDLHATARWMLEQRPSLVVHCAAWTDVDGCESDPERAWRDNVWATRHVAMTAQLAEAALCHVSTDYVFDGTKPEPYVEEDAAGPLNVYGRTKLAAELQALLHAPRVWVVRTSWLFGAGGRNFVRTVAGLLRERDEIRVVNDQRGAPTYVVDLAAALLTLVDRASPGIYHVTNSGEGTWFEVAVTVGEQLGTRCRIVPCTSAEYPRPARRPQNSRLAMRRWAQAGLAPLRPWREAVREYVVGLDRETVS
jgi:dTDP-4-dehydrorhamnose reductase